jgi:hypothetical protein
VHPLKLLLAQRLSSGLARKSITTPSRWASAYRVMGNPYPGLYNFDHHPWMREMHDTTCPVTVGMKSAQMGYTEWALNKAFFYLDVKKMDVLYVLPNMQPDASVFSASRFDVAVELSQHLVNLFGDVQNVTHKRAGTCNMYIRGSNSRSQLKSVPVSLLILDEVDEMVQEHIPLADERLSGQIERCKLMLSTPTIPDFGIDFHYQKSSKEHFFFKCPSCSRSIELKWPDSVVMCGNHESDPEVEKSHLICYECKATLHHEDKINFMKKSEWVPEYKDRMEAMRGFYINQLYSMNFPVADIVRAYLNSLKDIATEQELWNSKLGLPHIVAGAKITMPMVDQCIGEHLMLDFNRQGLVTMGVDVGRKIHVEIDDWDTQGRSGHDVNSYATPRLLKHLEVDTFEELDSLMFDFNVRYCVCDAQPERREAIKFANRFPGKVSLCLYPVGQNGRTITQGSEEEMIIKVDRTSWLDLSLGRFKGGNIILPRNTGLDYKEHIMAQVRITKKDNNGNPLTRYETQGNRQDHYAHARNYAEIALPFAIGLGATQNFSG